jgi:hypothetical protein
VALHLVGRGGELRLGTKRIATLAAWTKDNTRVTFTVASVNRFVAGLGAPTHIVLALTPKVLGTYPVVSGGLDDGAVMVDTTRLREEHGTL